MAFKENAIKRTITGTIQKPNGAPAKGKITFTLQDSLSGRQENVVYSKQVATEELDENGFFSTEFVVTARGLTTEEETARENAISQKADKESQLDQVTELINAYLQKAAAEPVTTEETDTFNANKLTKNALQSDVIQLTMTIAEINDYEKKLLASGSPVLIQMQLTDPKATDRYETVIPIGEGPIDLSELGRDAGVISNVYASQASLNTLRAYIDGRFIKTTAVPVLANSPGTAGEIAISTTHLYVCIAANTWRRTQLSSW